MTFLFFEKKNRQIWPWVLNPKIGGVKPSKMDGENFMVPNPIKINDLGWCFPHDFWVDTHVLPTDPLPGFFFIP